MKTREILSSIRSAVLLALFSCGGAVFGESIELTADSNLRVTVAAGEERTVDLVTLGGSGEWGWGQGNFRTNNVLEIAGRVFVEGNGGVQIAEWPGDGDCHVIVSEGGSLTNDCDGIESCNVGRRAGNCSLEVRGGSFFNRSQLNLGPQKWVFTEPYSFAGATNNLLLVSDGGECWVGADVYIGAESPVDVQSANVLRAESDGEIEIGACIRVLGSGNEIVADDGRIKCNSLFAINEWDQQGYTNTCLRFSGSRPRLEVMQNTWLWRKARLVFELPADGYEEGVVPFKSVLEQDGLYFKIEDDTEFEVDVSAVKRAGSVGRFRETCLIESANGFRFVKAGTGAPDSSTDVAVPAEDVLEKWNAKMPRGGRLTLSEDGKRICFDYRRPGLIIHIR